MPRRTSSCSFVSSRATQARRGPSTSRGRRQGLPQAVRRLEPDERLGAARARASRKRRALALPGRQEAQEDVRDGGQARDRQRRGRGRGARHDLDPVTGRRGRGDQPLARVRQRRHSGVGHERDRLAAARAARAAPRRGRPRAAPGHAMRRAGDAEARGELGRHARVLAEDRVGLGEGAPGARGQVLEIPDGRSDDEEPPGFFDLAHGETENSTERPGIMAACARGAGLAAVTIAAAASLSGELVDRIAATVNDTAIPGERGAQGHARLRPPARARREPGGVPRRGSSTP